MCNCPTLDGLYWFLVSMIIVIVLWSIYVYQKDRETDRQITTLERENDKLENEIYNLESIILDLEEKLKNERTRFKATVNLLTKK